MTLAEAARLALAEARSLGAPTVEAAVQAAWRALQESRRRETREALALLAGWALVALAKVDGEQEPAPPVDLAAIRERADRCPGTWRSEHGAPVVQLGYAEQIINRAILNGPLCFRRKRGRSDADSEDELLGILREVLAPAYAAQADRVALLAEVQRLQAELSALRGEP